MNTKIKDDFVKFMTNCDLFNCDVKLYDSKGGTLMYEGKGIYDKKPMPIQDENGLISYQGHKSILTLSMSLLTFLSGYVSLKGYYIEVTDNNDTISYLISNSNYSNNVGSIYCELKEA